MNKQEIRQTLIDLDLKVEDFAAKVGIAKTYLSGILSNKRKCSGETMANIANKAINLSKSAKGQARIFIAAQNRVRLLKRESLENLKEYIEELLKYK